MKNNVWKAFVKLYDDDEEKARQWLEENVTATNRAIEEQEMITRENDESDETAEETTEVETQEENIEIDEGVIEAVVSRMQEVENEEIIKLRTLVEELTTANNKLVESLEQVSKALQIVDGRLDALEVDEDEKKRQYQVDLPGVKVQRVTYKPRQAENGKVEQSFSDLATARMPKGAY